MYVSAVRHFSSATRRCVRRSTMTDFASLSYVLRGLPSGGGGYGAPMLLRSVPSGTEITKAWHDELVALSLSTAGVNTCTSGDAAPRARCLRAPRQCRSCARRERRSCEESSAATALPPVASNRIDHQDEAAAEIRRQLGIVRRRHGGQFVALRPIGRARRCNQLTEPRPASPSRP